MFNGTLVISWNGSAFHQDCICKSCVMSVSHVFRFYQITFDVDLFSFFIEFYIVNKICKNMIMKRMQLCALLCMFIYHKLRIIQFRFVPFVNRQQIRNGVLITWLCKISLVVVT